MTLTEMQKMLDEIEQMDTLETRVFVVGVTVFPMLYGITMYVARAPHRLFMPTLTRYGLRYANVYFLNSTHVGAHTITEVTNPATKAQIIRGLERFK